MKLLQELHQLSEQASVNANVLRGVSANDIMDEIHDILFGLEKKYKSHEVTAKTVASAPDTSKFRASVGGMIAHERNVTIHGHYGNVTQWQEFLKIGGGISVSTRNQIHKDFISELAKLIDREPGSDSTVIYCDDAKVIVGSHYGTNWGGIGAFKHKLESAYRPEKIK